MNQKRTMALAVCLIAGFSTGASAADGGILTRCHGESSGQRWAITDGNFSFEVCKARVIDCTGNANATVHYENMGPVLVPYPVKTCTSRVPGGAPAPKPSKSGS
jgi:hypothetical protein